MLDIEDFKAVFPAVGYTEIPVNEIIQFRNRLGGKTFFERLLDLLHIKRELPEEMLRYEHHVYQFHLVADLPTLYPPERDTQLRELHKRIVEAPIALHYKHCLLFYLLKDLNSTNHEHTDIANAFALNVHLEKRFWTFIEGLWALDHLQLDTAVESLTYPGIIPTFPDEIMLALLNKDCHMRDGRSIRQYILPMAYYNCTKPPLANQEARTQFASYMADREVTETFYWIRERPEAERKQLLEILIERILRKKEWDEEERDKEKSAFEFINLPLNEVEEKWFEKYLTDGQGRNLPAAKDTVLMRRIATGKLRDAARENGMKGMRHEHVNWETLREGIKKGLGPRVDETPFRV